MSGRSGRARTSTLVLGAVWILTFALYLEVRPAPAPATELVPAVRVPVSTTTLPPPSTTVAATPPTTVDPDVSTTTSIEATSTTRPTPPAASEKPARSTTTSVPAPTATSKHGGKS